MTEFLYNRLKSNRTRAIALGLIVILLNATFVYLVYVLHKQGRSIGMAAVSLISIISLGLLYFFGRMPFGQAMGIAADKKFATYYRLGSFKSFYQEFNAVDKVTLEQDNERYYCLTLTLTDGHIKVLEKYPTLTEANERLNEFAELLK